METILNIGDEFKIKTSCLSRKCTYKERTYIVSRCSPSYVSYKDNRTNIKCTCSNCRRYVNDKGEKELLRTNVIFIKSGKQRNREIALSLILGKD